MDNIRVRAGRRAYELIRAGGFSLDRIGTYFGPAGGPRWLVASGFDLTLLEEGLLGRTRSRSGSSAPRPGPGALRPGCSRRRSRATAP